MNVSGSDATPPKRQVIDVLPLQLGVENSESARAQWSLVRQVGRLGET